MAISKSMKFLLVFFFCAVSKLCIGQKCWSLDQGWIPCSMSDTLIDNLTGTYYVVNRSERCIKAYNQSKKKLWETNPWESKVLSQIMKSTWKTSYENPDSIAIHAIDFPHTKYMGGDDAIVIYFSDRIVGSLNRTNGRFTYSGRN